LPTYDFDAAPLLDPVSDLSPRMKDETWSAYESQSETPNGATALRHDTQLLEKLIIAFQLQAQDLKIAAKRNKVRSACSVLIKVLINGQV